MAEGLLQGITGGESARLGEGGGKEAADDVELNEEATESPGVGLEAEVLLLMLP